MDEFSLIQELKQSFYRQPSLQRGIGDDAAVFRETANDLVIAVDTFVEDIHFTEKTIRPFQLGYRLLAANFSDLAAMGAFPLYYLVSIVVPKKWSTSNVLKIVEGMRSLADMYHADLIGGDTVSGSKLILSVTVVGRVSRGKARYRSEAKPNDLVFVTGTLGDACAGLHILLHDLKVDGRDYFIMRHQTPEPRIEFAYSLQAVERLALNDISDGLGNETHEIAEESEVSIVLYDDKIPVHPYFINFPKKFRQEWKYFGGEDFELVGTVSKEEWKIVQEKARELGLPITVIGYVTDKKEHPVYVKKEEEIHPLKKAGYTHLK